MSNQIIPQSNLNTSGTSAPFLKRFKKDFLIALVIVIIGLFLFILINPSSIYPLTFSNFFYPFIILAVYFIFLLKLGVITKRKTAILEIFALTLIAISIVSLKDYNIHYYAYLQGDDRISTYFLNSIFNIFSLYWLLSLGVLWYSLNKIKLLNTKGIIGFILVISSIIIQSWVYLYGPCFGAFGMKFYQVGSFCPESGMISLGVLALGGIVLIMGLLCILFGKKKNQ